MRSSQRKTPQRFRAAVVLPIQHLKQGHSFLGCPSDWQICGGSTCVVVISKQAGASVIAPCTNANGFLSPVGGGDSRGVEKRSRENACWFAAATDSATHCSSSATCHCFDALRATSH